MRFVKGSHKMGWFTPRKFATRLNYEMGDVGSGTAHEFRDIPVDDIEGGKLGPTLSWATQPGDIIAFYGGKFPFYHSFFCSIADCRLHFVLNFCFASSICKARRFTVRRGTHRRRCPGASSRCASSATTPSSPPAPGGPRRPTTTASFAQGSRCTGNHSFPWSGLDKAKSAN